MQPYLHTSIGGVSNLCNRIVVNTITDQFQWSPLMVACLGQVKNFCGASGQTIHFRENTRKIESARSVWEPCVGFHRTSGSSSHKGRYVALPSFRKCGQTIFKYEIFVWAERCPSFKLHIFTYPQNEKSRVVFSKSTEGSSLKCPVSSKTIEV